MHYEDSAVVWLCLLGPSRWFESLMDLMDLDSGPAMYNASNALLRFGIFCWSSESPTF